jgi:hypothetical protein
MFNRFLNHQLILIDQRDTIRISWDQLFGYCGPSQVIATTLAFRLFEQAIREMSPHTAPKRDEMGILTAFPGRGILECIEMITRIPTLASHRLTVAPEAGPPEAPSAYIGRFYFEVQIGNERRSYIPIPDYFDDEFRTQVALFQNKKLNDAEYHSYMSYKWQKAQSIINYDGEFFKSEILPPLSLEPEGKAQWYGLQSYADLHS